MRFAGGMGSGACFDVLLVAASTPSTPCWLGHDVDDRRSWQPALDLKDSSPCLMTAWLS